MAKKRRGLTYKDYESDAFMLPKGLALKFTAATDVRPPYAIHWRCRNEGDEARDAGQLSWERTEETCWTSTRFKGRQRMLCEIEKNGRTVAQATHVVNISAGGWNNPDA